MANNSDFIFDFFCQYCGSEGKHLEAEGFCTDCNEYLCSQCCGYHSKLSITKQHSVLSKDDMPRHRAPSTVSDVCTNICQKHDRKVLEYYCYAHKEIVCSVCVTLTHKDCKVEYIPEVAQNAENAKEYAKFEWKLQTTVDCTNNLLCFVKDNIDRCDKYSVKAREEWRNFRQKIIQALDKATDELEAEIEKKKSEDVAKMKSISDMGKNILLEAQTNLDKYQALKKGKLNCQMFLYSKNESARVEKLQASLKEAGSQAKIQHYTFVPNDDILKRVDRAEALGSFRDKYPKQLPTAEFIGDINVGTESDKNKCWITGCELLPEGRLVVVDHQNDKVKLIDAVKRMLTQEINIPAFPFDLTVVDGNEIVVSSCNKQKFYVFSVNKELQLTREIFVSSTNLGICYYQGRIVVCNYKSNSVEILNMNGETLVKLNESGDYDALKDVYGCLVAPDGQSVYVTNSDEKQRSITMVPFYVDRQRKSSNKNLLQPRGMAADPAGMLYVSSANGVALFTADLESVGIVLKGGELDGRPWSVCYSEEEDRLYVGSKSSDVIKVYQLHRD